MNLSFIKRYSPCIQNVKEFHIFHLYNAALLCNSYSIGCPPVRGYNPRALASGLSYV